MKTKDILIFIFALIVISAIAYGTFLFFYVQKKYAETPKENTELISESNQKENKTTEIPEFGKVEIDKNFLFGIWDSNDGGDADFRITENEFYLVDFFESSEYKIDGNLISIKGSDFYKNGIILNISKDSLKIKWVELNVVVDYWKFKKE